MNSVEWNTHTFSYMYIDVRCIQPVKMTKFDETLFINSFLTIKNIIFHIVKF